MSDTTTTNTEVVLNILALATAVNDAINFYDAGLTLPEFAAIFATWDLLTDLDPNNEETDPDVLVDKMRPQVAAVIAGTATFEIKIAEEKKS